MKSFVTRAISALIAVFIMIGLYVGWGGLGIKISVIFAVLVGSWELMRLLFKEVTPFWMKYLFYALCWVVFGLGAWMLSLGSVAYSLSLILLLAVSLLTMNKSGNLQALSMYQLRSALGLFYMGLLPSFAYRILESPAGVSWFVVLLAVVFAGDTFAYAFGVLWGKSRIMPSVSPKKSYQGSVGGLLGSALAGYVCWYFLLPHVNLPSLILLSVVAGLIAQFGDFFESLLKRLADVKDSGNIMPGHGGVLDRLDGVLFASPVILLGTLFLGY